MSRCVTHIILEKGSPKLYSEFLEIRIFSTIFASQGEFPVPPISWMKNETKRCDERLTQQNRSYIHNVNSKKSSRPFDKKIKNGNVLQMTTVTTGTIKDKSASEHRDIKTVNKGTDLKRGRDGRWDIHRR